MAGLGCDRRPDEGCRSPGAARILLALLDRNPRIVEENPTQLTLRDVATLVDARDLKSLGFAVSRIVRLVETLPAFGRTVHLNSAPFVSGFVAGCLTERQVRSHFSAEDQARRLRHTISSGALTEAKA